MEVLSALPRLRDILTKMTKCTACFATLTFYVTNKLQTTRWTGIIKHRESQTRRAAFSFMRNWKAAFSQEMHRNALLMIFTVSQILKANASCSKGTNDLNQLKGQVVQVDNARKLLRKSDKLSCCYCPLIADPQIEIHVSILLRSRASRVLMLAYFMFIQ